MYSCSEKWCVDRAQRSQSLCSAEEQVLLDENKEAARHSLYSTAAVTVSPDGTDLIISGAVHGLISGRCLGVVCQIVAVLG